MITRKYFTKTSAWQYFANTLVLDCTTPYLFSISTMSIKNLTSDLALLRIRRNLIWSRTEKMSKSDQQQKKRKASQVWVYSHKTLKQIDCMSLFQRAKDLSAAILNERLTSVMERVLYHFINVYILDILNIFSVDRIDWTSRRENRVGQLHGWGGQDGLCIRARAHHSYAGCHSV